MRAILGVGKLTSLELLDPLSGKTKTLRVEGKWLGWSPSAKQFIICTKVGKEARLVGTGQPYPTKRELDKIEKAHRRFHQAKARSMAVVEAPDPTGKLRQVALLKALTYRVPKQVLSPEKNPSHWHHAFGDTGHKGGVYTAKVMPALVKDAKGNLFIKRRKGNIFTVDTWLRG